MKLVSKRRYAELLQTSQQCSEHEAQLAKLQEEIDHYKGVIIYAARRTIDEWARGFLEENYHFPDPTKRGVQG